MTLEDLLAGLRRLLLNESEEEPYLSPSLETRKVAPMMIDDELCGMKELRSRECPPAYMVWDVANPTGVLQGYTTRTNYEDALTSRQQSVDEETFILSILVPCAPSLGGSPARTREEERTLEGISEEEPEVVRWYSSDPGQEYRVTLIAWSTNAWFYESCGATCRLEHWEDGWVERPAGSITINNTYEPLRIGDYIPPRTCKESDEEDMDCYEYAVKTTGRLILAIHKVHSTAVVDVPNGEVAHLGPVSKVHRER